MTGAAREAWGTGRLFHVVKLNCGGTVAGYMSQSSTGGDDVAGALQVIESVVGGWTRKLASPNLKGLPEHDRR